MTQLKARNHSIDPRLSSARDSLEKTVLLCKASTIMHVNLVLNYCNEMRPVHGKVLRW